jgi:hypothetical protein
MVHSLRDNAPGKLQTRSVFKDYEIKFAEQLRNCEDVILLEDVEGVALLSCDESRDQWNTVMVRLCFILFVPLHVSAQRQPPGTCFMFRTRQSVPCYSRSHSLI